MKQIILELLLMVILPFLSYSCDDEYFSGQTIYKGDVEYKFNGTSFEVSGYGPGIKRDCSLLSVIQHNGKEYAVTKIASLAFRNCSVLESITIPESIVEIDDDAFSGCSGLTSVAVSCADETDFAKYLSRRDILSVFHTTGLRGKEHKLLVNGVEQKDVVIPNSVTSIGAGAFRGCTSLTSITIPNSVTNIGFEAFSNCSDLTSVTIPNSVTSIGDCLFSGTNVKKAYVDSPLFCKGSAWGSIENLVIGNSVKEIASYAFDKKGSLKKVTIGDGVVSIGEGAFYWTDLSHAELGKSVKTIGRAAFCPGWAVGRLFINIPSSVTEIGELAFHECSIEMNCYASDPPKVIGPSPLFNSLFKNTIHVPANSLAKYKQDRRWIGTIIGDL